MQTHHGFSRRSSLSHLGKVRVAQNSADWLRLCQGKRSSSRPGDPMLELEVMTGRLGRFIDQNIGQLTTPGWEQGFAESMKPGSPGFVQGRILDSSEVEFRMTKRPKEGEAFWLGSRGPVVVDGERRTFARDASRGWHRVWLERCDFNCCYEAIPTQDGREPPPVVVRGLDRDDLRHLTEGKLSFEAERLIAHEEASELLFRDPLFWGAIRLDTVGIVRRKLELNGHGRAFERWTGRYPGQWEPVFLNWPDFTTYAAVLRTIAAGTETEEERPITETNNEVPTEDEEVSDAEEKEPEPPPFVPLWPGHGEIRRFFPKEFQNSPLHQKLGFYIEATAARTSNHLNSALRMAAGAEADRLHREIVHDVADMMGLLVHPQRGDEDSFILVKPDGSQF